MTGHIDKSPADLAQDLRDLSDQMLDVATSLDYYGGMDSRSVTKAQGLTGCAEILRMWAQEVEGDHA